MLGRFWFAGLAMLLHPMLMVGVIAIPAVLAVPSVPQDLSEAAMKGAKLTAAQAETLEHQLAENPQSLSARAQLLGYYYLTGSNDPEKHAEHVLWFIRNMPESEVVGGPLAQILPRLNPDGYLEAKAEWLRLIEESPDAVVLLQHAADFLRMRDRALSVSLLERAEAVEPANPHWATELGRLHWREAHNQFRGGSDVTGAARALADFERAYELSGTAGRANLMPDLAVTAFAAGDQRKARSHAEAMLAAIPPKPRGGKFIHYGNLVLGRIALSEGDLEEAGARLLAAGRTEGAPLRTFRGPDMALAKALLERGEPQVVLRYLELCLDIWERGQEDLRDWIVLIEAGRVPDFDHNFLF